MTLVKFPLPKRKGKLASSLRLIYIYNSFFVFLSVFRLVFALPFTMGWMTLTLVEFPKRKRERGSGEWLRPQPPPNLASTVNSPKRRKTTPNVFLPWF